MAACNQLHGWLRIPSAKPDALGTERAFRAARSSALRKRGAFAVALVCVPVLLSPLPVFASSLARGVGRKEHCLVRAEQKEPATGSEAGDQKRGYQFGDLFINKLTGKDKYEFGDLSRFLGGKLQDAASQITGKETYEFGDISRALDTKAKAEVNKITGKDTYEFGDLTKYLDAKAKDQVNNMTGKETYEFGDISREIARRVREGEVDQEDLFLLLRVVLTLGAGLTPVAHLLPVEVLMSLYTTSLEYEVGSRVASKVSVAIAEELDRRAKGSILGEGNEDYVLGDFTKAQLQKAVTGITGKDSYEFGDITKALLRKLEQGGQKS